MLDIILNSITIEILLMVTAVGFILLVPKLTTLFLKMSLQGVVGIAFISGINFALSSFGVFVGVNFITVGIASVLGIPGVVSLYILQAIVS